MVLKADAKSVGGIRSNEDSDDDHVEKEVMAQDLGQDQLMLLSPVCPLLKAGSLVHLFFLIHFQFCFIYLISCTDSKQ